MYIFSENGSSSSFFICYYIYMFPFDKRMIVVLDPCALDMHLRL